MISAGGHDVQPLCQLEEVRLTGQIGIRVGQPHMHCRTPIARRTSEAVDAANQRLEKPSAEPAYSR